MSQQLLAAGRMALMRAKHWRRPANRNTARWSTIGYFLVVASLVGSTPRPVEAARARDFLRQPESWFASDKARQTADHILAWQTDAGGWPKNIDTTSPRPATATDVKGTFDNGATTDELRVLARVYRNCQEPAYRQAFDRGLEFILSAQYANGGWPQTFPPGDGYRRHITFNDGAMVRLLEFIREVARDERYDFVANSQRVNAQEAFDRGIQCILRCQIEVDGQLTAWCAQHDEIDFRPRPARAYELESLSGAESVGIVRLLMSLDHPSAETDRAIEAACGWLQQVKLSGIRLEERPDPHAPRGHDRVIVNDPAAPPLWARFYEIGSNRPIFCDRDGIRKYSLAEIGSERRNGYAWLTSLPRQLLEREYPNWQRRRMR